jgi:uncharacterized protein (DUF2267 family)
VSENEREVHAFETTMRTSMGWIRDYGEALGQTHAGLCYRCLRAGLHAIRDRLPVVECAAFAAQLPLLVRGMWYDGWRPAHVPSRVHSAEEVLAGVERELDGGMRAAPGAVLQATFAVLEKHVDGGEVRKLRTLLPEAMRALWPASAERPIARPAG